VFGRRVGARNELAPGQSGRLEEQHVGCGGKMGLTLFAFGSAVGAQLKLMD